MKKIFYVFALSLCCILIDVYAQNHDVQAKYEVTYNVTLFEGILNNNTIEVEVDNYTLEFTSTSKNVKVVIIKTTEEANNYIKSISNNDENYFVIFYKDEKKITSGEFQVDIKNSNKVLNVYDSNGNEIDKSSEKKVLDKNNYFISVTDKETIEEDRVIFTDINSFVHELEEVELNSNSVVDIYNYKNVKIENTRKLGTGYRVIVTNNNVVQEYTVVVMGDITGDAKINLNDVTRLYHNYKKIEDMEEIFVLAGNVADSNNEINLNDITKLYHYHKGIIPNL